MEPVTGTPTQPVIDCRGLQCPAPILRLSEAARKHKDTAKVITVLATDVDFPVDLEAWCRTTKASVARLEREEGGVIRAQIRLAGAAPTIPSAREQPSAPEQLAVVDLTGIPVVSAMRKLAELSASPGKRVTVVSDASGFEGRLAAWSSATDTAIESVHREGSRVTAILRFPQDEATGPAITLAAPMPAPPAPVVTTAPAIAPAKVIAEAPAPPPAPAPIVRTQVEFQAPAQAVSSALAAASGEEVVPRENRATLLILKNDLEALLAALMVANASASQGMQVEVYFAFWGIHLLRGESPRTNAPESNRGLIQTMMLWMVPKGPGRQKLGKLHMGGIGTRILLWLMRKRNILALDKLVLAAVSQGVRFNVCSMSMGLMGLSQRDIVDLPNVSFAGVTSFAESARRSAVSLVF